MTFLPSCVFVLAIPRDLLYWVKNVERAAWVEKAQDVLKTDYGLKFWVFADF